jgi:hypothetical protein
VASAYNRQGAEKESQEENDSIIGDFDAADTISATERSVPSKRMRLDGAVCKPAGVAVKAVRWGGGPARGGG